MRVGIDETMLHVAVVVARRGTCKRRQVGCVLTNQRNHILSTGYNGVAAGVEHCVDYPCPGAQAPSGEGLDLCQAIHAEQNALLQCPDVYQIHTAWCTTAPCIHCVKLLLNTSCQRIIFLHSYPHAKNSEELWGERTWRHSYRLAKKFAELYAWPLPPTED